MYPKILHIYGPFEINSFNAAILIGILVFLYACIKHPGRAAIISTDDFLNIATETALAGIIGGRILHIVSEWDSYKTVYDMLSLWNGGMSILGALCAVIAYSAVRLKIKGIALLSVYDIAALYAPIIHSIARVGCFLVGCCYGSPTSAAWGVTYSHPQVFAPLHVKIHPTQLYSSGFFLVLFLVLYALHKRNVLLPGQMGFLYLMGMSGERFIVDFFRGDRILMAHQSLTPFSFHQWIALGIFMLASTGFIFIQAQRQRINESV